MSTNEDSSKSSLCKTLGLKPFTKNNILFYYAPIQSLVSYAALSINVMNPSLAIRLLPKKDVTNFLLIHTLFGTTLYIYSRPHLQIVPTNRRIAYSVVGGALFSMGSVLVWAVLRSAVPRNQGLATALGVTSGLLIARLGYDYLNDVDKQIAKKT